MASKLEHQIFTSCTVPTIYKSRAIRKSNEIIKATHCSELFEELREKEEEEGNVEKLGGFQMASSLLASSSSDSSRLKGGFQSASSLLSVDKNNSKTISSKISNMVSVGTGFQTASSLLAASSSKGATSGISANSSKGAGISDMSTTAARCSLEPQDQMKSPVHTVKSIQLDLCDKVKNDLIEITERYNNTNSSLNSSLPDKKPILKTFTLPKTEESQSNSEKDRLLRVSPKSNVMTIDFSKWQNIEKEEKEKEVMPSPDTPDTINKRKLDVEFYRDHSEARKRQKSSTSDVSSSASSEPKPKTDAQRREERKKLEALKAERSREKREGVADNVIKLLQPLYDKQCIPDKEVFKKTARALTHQFIKRGIVDRDAIHFKTVQLCNTGTSWDESLFSAIKNIR